MPRSRAITSAILFSNPSDLLFENGRLSGSPQTRSGLGSSAAAAGHASVQASIRALANAHPFVHELFTSDLHSTNSDSAGAVLPRRAGAGRLGRRQATGHDLLFDREHVHGAAQRGGLVEPGLVGHANRPEGTEWVGVRKPRRHGKTIPPTWAGVDGDILLLVGPRERHRVPDAAGRKLILPQELAALGVDGLEPAVHGPVK